VERVELTRALYPDATIVVNTNGAAYDPKRHDALKSYDVILSLHVESLREETYNELMQPLRLERTLPKFEMIMESFRGRVTVSVPVSKKNIGELDHIRHFFLSRGATAVAFDPLSSRCAEDDSRSGRWLSSLRAPVVSKACWTN